MRPANRIIIIWTLALTGIFCMADEPGRKPITPQLEYTKDSPGEWDGLQEIHIPKVKVHNESRGKQKIEIGLNSKFKFNKNHYIEKIGIFNENREDIAVQSFHSSGEDKYTAYFEVDSLPESDKIKAFVKCNLHDLWTIEIFPKNSPEIGAKK